MGIFNQSDNKITPDLICEALCELAKNNIDKFQDAGCGMYNLEIGDDEKLKCLIDENEVVEYFQIYPDHHSLSYMWLLTLTYPENEPDMYASASAIDYQLSDYYIDDLLIIYQVVKESLEN